MHLILCSKRRSVMHQILQSYQNHLFSKLREAGDLADQDPTSLLRKLSSLSCWTISSSNWPSAIKVVAAIHNNFIQKLRKRIWNPRTYDKSKWEDAMNITLKLKTSPRPSNLPATSTISEQAIDEDIITDTAADAGVEVLASSPKENNTASTSLSSHPNIAAALSAPNDNASGGLDVSMHARTTTSASPPNASLDMATEDDPPC
ncbi:hypothetical protein RclHR1_12760007 [Rhizophagus clarus]|uniref:Uncharacterized protein n=1 Tax=Rhizophagus clarus TaxID=94130 RepID=A0A2Z6QKL9_9GLOM|nr:hypothetical protein RclHR1_12760007 [Rhizophagus clarus]